MKSRNGFVSNSSSSSFIIAFKNGKTPCPTCGNCNPKMDILKELCSWEDMTPDQASDYHCDKHKTQITDLQSQGYSFAQITIDNNAEGMLEVVTNSKDLVVIGDGGY